SRPLLSLPQIIASFSAILNFDLTTIYYYFSSPRSRSRHFLVRTVLWQFISSLHLLFRTFLTEDSPSVPCFFILYSRFFISAFLQASRVRASSLHQRHLLSLPLPLSNLPLLH
ncbi:hypothetical protein V6Z79_006602, partial [Aspergillus fumigatus]